LAIALAIAPVSAALAQGETKFDLTCVGEVRRHPGTEVGSYVPWTGRLKIDLETKTFCQDDCSKVEQIYSITPEKIVLLRKADGEVFDFSEIQRSNGFYLRTHSITKIENGTINDQAEDYRATCSPAPFSGFPKTLF
jgi:hypothetical protein